jgi:tetratricopeptide (TPR) repeat protein
MTTGKDRHDYPELPTKLDETVNQAEFIELNEIILTACRADPRRRYASADQMRADLLLLQSGRSIKQVHKLERRLALATRIGIATAAAALLAVGGYIGSVKQIQRARRAERLAAANAATARSETAKSERVAQYLKDVLQDLGPSVAMVHELAIVRGILDRASGRIDRDLVNQPGTAIELRETLADIYRELGFYDKMAELARKNLELARKTFGDENRPVANALGQLGEAYFWRDKWEDAEAFQRMALRMRRKLLGNEHIDVAQSLLLLGNALHSRTNTPAVEAVYLEGLEICGRLPISDEITLMKADILQNLGVELRNGRLEEAEAFSRQALEMKRNLSDNQPISSVGKASEVLAMILRDAGKFGEAEAAYLDALTAYTKFVGKDHHLVGRALSGLGETLGYEGRLPEAETMLREAVATQRRTGRNENFDLTYALGSLAQVLEQQGKFAEAESAYCEVLEIRQRLSAKPRGALLLHLAAVLRRQGRVSEADALIPDAIAAFRDQSDLGEIEAQNSLAWLLSTHHSSQFRDGQMAVVYAGKAVASTSRTNATYLDTLAAAYAEAHDFTRAVAVQKEAMSLLVREEQRQDFASRLNLYKANTPYRELE